MMKISAARALGGYFFAAIVTGVAVVKAIEITIPSAGDNVKDAGFRNSIRSSKRKRNNA